MVDPFVCVNMLVISFFEYKFHPFASVTVFSSERETFRSRCNRQLSVNSPNVEYKDGFVFYFNDALYAFPLMTTE